MTQNFNEMTKVKDRICMRAGIQENGEEPDPLGLDGCGISQGQYHTSTIFMVSVSYLWY